MSAFLFSYAIVSVAQDFFVYPSKGQSSEQTEKDKFECYGWAKNETGFDPIQTPTATRPPPQKEQEKVGAAGGAVGGAIVGGAISGLLGGDVEAGAAAGAVGGGLFGGVRRSGPKKT